MRFETSLLRTTGTVAHWAPPWSRLGFRRQGTLSYYSIDMQVSVEINQLQSIRIVNVILHSPSSSKLFDLSTFPNRIGKLAISLNVVCFIVAPLSASPLPRWRVGMKWLASSIYYVCTKTAQSQPPPTHGTQGRNKAISATEPSAQHQEGLTV